MSIKFWKLFFLSYRKKRVSGNISVSADYYQVRHPSDKKRMSIAAPEREERNGGVGYLPEKYTRIKWSSYEWVATAAKTGGKTRPFCTFGGQALSDAHANLTPRTRAKAQAPIARRSRRLELGTGASSNQSHHPFSLNHSQIVSCTGKASEQRKRERDLIIM